MELKIKPLSPKIGTDIPLPRFATAGAACMDLCACVDVNGLQIDGATKDVMPTEPLDKKFEAFGWNVIDVADGNDVEQVSAAVKQAKANRATGRPTMVILNTLKGCGVKWIEEMGAGNHNTNVSEEQAKAAIAEIREG